MGKESKPKLIVLTGPTAVGKTTLSIELAQALNCPILSCDSRQFYKEMNIGTAKPSPEELDAAKHYFINNKSIKDLYTVGDYEKEAIEVLEKIYSSNSTAILCGGSGLFIKALCEGLDSFPTISEEVAKSIEKDFQQKDLAELQEELASKDPQYYEKVDLQNPRRIQRALSVIRQSGLPYSSFLNQKQKNRFFDPVYICLQRQKTELYQRINLRVDLMIQQGLEEEVLSLLDYKEQKVFRTVGYQEWLPYFETIQSKEKTVELIKQNSRRYAKRQMTWFRNSGSFQFLDAQSADLEKLKSIIFKKIR